jgi:hypothetical protein
MAYRSPFLSLSNEIILQVIEFLAISSPRLDSPTRVPTPPKHLSTTNRLLRQLVRPLLLERIVLSTHLGSRWGETSLHAWNSVLHTSTDLSAISNVRSNIRRFTLDHTRSNITSRYHQFSTMISFMGCLTKLQHLEVCIDITSLDFRLAIERLRTGRFCYDWKQSKHFVSASETYLSYSVVLMSKI